MLAGGVRRLRDGGSAADVPEGFKTLSGDGWSLAYPAGWEVSEVDGQPAGPGPRRAPAASHRRRPWRATSSRRRSRSRSTPSRPIRRFAAGNWKITRDAKFELDGADARAA